MSEAVLQGSLNSFKIPDLLKFLALAQKTGTLTLTGEGRVSFVLFRSGAVLFAGSDQEKLRLSAILLRRKIISRQHFESIDALMRRERSRFGELAIQQKVLTEDQLRDYLKIQVSEVIFDTFVWDGGRFTFSEELQVPSHAVTISVDLPNLIMEGSRRIDEWEQCRRLLPESSIIFRVVSAPKNDKITLTAEEWKILFLVNGQRTLDDLVRDSEDDPLVVYRIVYGLHANKLIEAVRPSPSANDTSGLSSTSPGHLSQDDTMRQAARNFQGDATVREGGGDDTSLLVNDDANLTYSDVVRPVIAQLTIADGVSGGTIIPLTDDEYLVGRQRENSIHLSDLGVSGHHARIFRSGDGYVIEDMKSRNGTWVNGSRIFHAALQNNDRLRMGATDFKYEVLFDPSKRA